MRIVQLIDSLDTGGAERMAVNYANALAGKMAFSGLVSTRKEGALKPLVHDDVTYCFLNKKGAADWKALLRLRAFCETHKVSHIHAHGSSYFTGFLLKLILPRLVLIWHNHNGRSETLTGMRFGLLRLASSRISGIISVNERLDSWAKAKLSSKKTIYLPNFVVRSMDMTTPKDLKGQAGKRAVVVANLREPKGHMTLVEAILLLREKLPGWTVHLVGTDYQDAYSNRIKDFIERHGLQDTVYLYGQRDDSGAFISSCDIALLPSDAEGLPLSLLEYGLYGKAVIATRVGAIPGIVNSGTDGLLVPASDPRALYKAMLELASDEQKRTEFGLRLQQKIIRTYSPEAVVETYLKWLDGLFNG